MSYDIIKLLNLEDYSINYEKIEAAKINNTLYCYLTLKKSLSYCPSCGGTNNYIHDYRIKKIKHSISTNNPCYIIYTARRYKCIKCNTIFYEYNPFSLKGAKNTNYTNMAILNALRSHTMTFTEVAGLYNLTITSVIRIFDQYVDCRPKALPKVVCFDEVYTTRRSYNKYAFVMVDLFTSEVIDIYSSRIKSKLSYSFNLLSEKDKNNVEFIVNAKEFCFGHVGNIS